MKHHSACSYYLKTLDLIRWGEGTVPGSRELIEWTQEVAFLRESSTFTAWFWDDKEFESLGETNDFYGFLTSPTLEDAHRYVKGYKITKDDRLSFVMTTVITDVAINVLDEKSSFGGRLEYEKLPTVWLKPAEDIVQKIKQEGYIDTELAPTVEELEVCREVVWSSKWDNPGDKMEEIVERLKREFSLPIPKGEICEGRR